MAGSEVSAMGSVRAVNSAQSIYAASCGAGFYSPSLANLATPPTIAGGDGFLGPDLGTDPSLKSGYSIALTAGAAAAGAPASCNGSAAGTVVSTYFVGASPTTGAGGRFFGSNQGGTIFQSTTAVAVTQTGAPAGGDTHTVDAAAVRMPVQPGTTLGPSVTAKIGEGGIGEVSRARIPSSTETWRSELCRKVAYCSWIRTVASGQSCRTDRRV